MAANWIALSASVRGATHERDGRVNQDAIRLHQPRNASDPLCVAMADGHGSPLSFRSDRGSALATECALRHLRRFVRKAGSKMPLSRLRREFERKWTQEVIDDWHRVVRADLKKNPFSFLEFAPFPGSAPIVIPGEELPFSAYLAYGATLVVMAVTRRHLFYAQLGDGDILLVHRDGRVTRPWPRKHAFFSNETVSLCSHHAVRQFHARVEPLRSGDTPALILLATDGYANCFNDDDGFFRVGSDFLEYLDEGGPAFVQEKLEEWLRESSRDGSGDDISVGLAVRLNALRRSGEPFVEPSA
jgi:serine/threonine protein phosphatase PrpC